MLSSLAGFDVSGILLYGPGHRLSETSLILERAILLHSIITGPAHAWWFEAR